MVGLCDSFRRVRNKNTSSCARYRRRRVTGTLISRPWMKNGFPGTHTPFAANDANDASARFPAAARRRWPVASDVNFVKKAAPKSSPLQKPIGSHGPWYNACDQPLTVIHSVTIFCQFFTNINIPVARNVTQGIII